MAGEAKSGGQRHTLVLKTQTRSLEIFRAGPARQHARPPGPRRSRAPGCGVGISSARSRGSWRKGAPARRRSRRFCPALSPERLVSGLLPGLWPAPIRSRGTCPQPRPPGGAMRFSAPCRASTPSVGAARGASRGPPQPPAPGARKDACRPRGSPARESPPAPSRSAVVTGWGAPPRRAPPGQEKGVGRGPGRQRTPRVTGVRSWMLLAGRTFEGPSTPGKRARAASHCSRRWGCVGPAFPYLSFPGSRPCWGGGG